MNMKEAIRYIKLTKLEDIGCSGKEYDDIIDLLKRGNKFEEMWGWLDNTISAYYGDPKYFHEYSTKQIIKIMSNLQQKYFPEGDING